MNHQDAKKALREYLNQKSPSSIDELIIIDEKTLEKSYGWIFFYDSKKYLETGIGA